MRSALSNDIGMASPACTHKINQTASSASPSPPCSPCLIDMSDPASPFMVEITIPDNAGTPKRVKTHPLSIQQMLDSMAFNIHGAKYDPILAQALDKSAEAQSETRRSQKQP